MSRDFGDWNNDPARRSHSELPAEVRKKFNDRHPDRNPLPIRIAFWVIVGIGLSWICLRALR